LATIKNQNMTATLDTPKVFISYSWKPISNKQKALELAKRLANDSVHVIIDEWDLGEGQDKYQFMEQMVNNSDIRRVLIICNKDYSEKANKKKGGVGVESLIISDEIYNQADQKKFIPVIFEKDSNEKAFVPTFIKSRIYIDLSSDNIFEDEYEKLLRNIYDKPASKRPPLGTIPAYLTEEEPTTLRTSHKVKVIENALKNEKRNSQVFIDDYYSTFIEALKDFEITKDELKPSDNVDEVVLKKIEDIKSLRNDFINFLDILLTYSYEFNSDRFIEFLEKLLEFISTQEANSFPSHTHGNLKIDHYRFFYYELFLYLTAIMIQKSKFIELGAVLHNAYIFYNSEIQKTETFYFTYFNQYVESLEKFRNERLQMRRMSVVADTVKQRADIPSISFEFLKECDSLLYYISILQIKKDNSFYWNNWWPYLSVYRLNHLPLLEKLISKRHFEKLKPLFDVSSIEKLKQNIEKIAELKSDSIARHYNRLPYINQVFNFKTMGQIK